MPDPPIPIIKQDPALKPIQPQQDNAIPMSQVLKGVPFRGGMFTDRDVTLIPTGGYSMIQNLRANHPGFEKRKGCRKQHATPDSSNDVMSLFQYSKGKGSERHFYAQMSSGAVLEASDAPPAVAAGVFGSSVFAGSTTDHIPACWSVIDDIVVYSNGSDQHQIYTGNDYLVRKVVVYNGADTPGIIPAEGKDYTDQATDGLATTYIDLSSLNSDHHCIFVCTAIPATSLKWAIVNPNGTAAVATGKYWNGAFTALPAFADGTALAGAAFGQTGAYSQTWTQPTDEIPHYMYGTNGFWYQIYLSSGATDADTKISDVKFNTTWQSLQHIWDGVEVDTICCQFYDASADTYTSFGSTNVDISNGTSSDILYIASLDPLVGVYVDVQETPNTTVDTTVSAINYFKNGNDWTGAVASLNDGSAGFSKGGYVTFARQSDVYKLQFGGFKFDMYWYAIKWDKTLSTDVKLTLTTLPYFDIAEFGQKGIVNCAWKDRMVYCFDRWPVDLYVSALHQPMVLTGPDATVLERPGDGRMNKVVCIRKFFNNILVFQEEKGTYGGCITMYQGYSPATFGKLVISTYYGTLNSKSAVVVEGVYRGFSKVEDKPTTVCFFLSHRGVFMTDGTTIVRISKSEVSSVQNYFDPKKSNECIRFGYESKMWMSYDSTYHCLRMGLVCGTSAIVPNVFLVYDIDDRTWSADSLAQEFSCIVDVEAASGEIPILQYAGGVNDGTVYQVNYGDDDVTTAIDAYATMELDGEGAEMLMREMILRQSGTCVVTPYLDGVAQTAITIT